MNYNLNSTDSFLEECLKSPEGIELDKTLAQTIKTEHEILELISTSIKHCKKNIAEIDKLLNIVEANDRLKRHLSDGFNLQKKVWEDALLIWNLCGFIQMISLEIKSAQKSLYFETDEWHRRNIIKQAYVMMYESSEDLLQQTGKHFLDVMSLSCSEEQIVQFKAIRKKWSLFRKNYEDEFQDVRNKVGAHREHDVMMQINTIESLNWSQTIELLLEYEKLTIEIAPYFSALIPAVVNGVGRFYNQ